MSVVATSDVEAGKTYELVETQNVRTEKLSPDMTWVNVNFKAKTKSILSNCWGNVSGFLRTVVNMDNFTLNIQVPAGKVCAIMGPSGAGKSSLLNVLAGRSSPAAGISIEGKVTLKFCCILLCLIAYFADNCWWKSD